MNSLEIKNLPQVQKKGKFDILKTFEIFNKENISILKEKIVEIILVEADNIFSKNKNMFNVNFKKNDSVQISVFNDKPTYDLLSNTWKRHKMKQKEKKNFLFLTKKNMSVSQRNS